MKKIGKIIGISLLSLMILIRIVDIIRVAGCQIPWLKIKTSCEYDNNHSIYEEIGLGYEYIEDSYDEGIGGIVGKIFGIKACDIPAGNLISCKNNKEENINQIIDESVVYTGTFHADYIDDNNQYLGDIPITGDSHRKLKVIKGETGYLYKYTFDVGGDMYDMLYHNISVTFESPVLLNGEEDFLSGNSKGDNVPFVKVSSIGLYAWHGGVQISNPEPATSLLYMRCFNDTSVDPRFRNGLVPAYSSGITQLTTISNQTIDIPFINHSSAVNFYYGYSEQYQGNIMDQCVLHLSHTNENTIQLPFKLSGGFGDSALILWFTNRESDSYCRHRDTEIQVSNGMTCYIYANDIENVIDIKLGDIRDIQ